MQHLQPLQPLQQRITLRLGRQQSLAFGGGLQAARGAGQQGFALRGVVQRGRHGMAEHRLQRGRQLHVELEHQPAGVFHRALHLGGEFRCWVDERRVFRVAARMPWVWAAEIGASFVPAGEGEG